MNCLEDGGNIGEGTPCSSVVCRGEVVFFFVFFFFFS